MEVRDFAEQVVFGSRLEDKLRAPRALTDRRPGPQVGVPDAPTRPPALTFGRTTRRERFPGAEAFVDARARGRALHDFANHELLALELMALALLRFPDASPLFRRGLVATMRDEQRHLQLYCERMAAHGVAFGDLPVSGFFWRAMAHVEGPREFSATMSLTFEQANLDHAVFYREVFARVGDHETAAVLDVILADEIAHVGRGLRCFERWRAPGVDLFEAHVAALRSPLSVARAKGRRFATEPRRRAGLPQAYVERLRTFSASRGRAPSIYVFDPAVEDDLAAGGRCTPSAALRSVARDLETLPIVAAASDDIVLLRRQPATWYLAQLDEAGFPLPELAGVDLEAGTLAPRAIAHERLGSLCPWGWSPRTRRLLSSLSRCGARVPDFVDQVAILHDKATAAKILGALLERRGESWWCGPDTVGRRVTTLEGVLRESVELSRRGYETVAVKAPLGTAGRQTIRIESARLQGGQEGWIARTLSRQGAVIVEPWLDAVCDLSFRLTITKPGAARVDDIGRFLTDGRGQYLGAVLGRPSTGLSRATRRFIGGDGRDPDRLPRTARRVAEVVASTFAGSGYRGPVGVDALIYRDVQGELRLRPVVEINPRLNMGHLAARLRRRIAPPSVGLWLTVRRRDVETAAYPDLQAYVRHKREMLPLRLHVSSGPARMAQGVVATTDPTDAACTMLMIVASSLRACLDVVADLEGPLQHVAHSG